MKKINKTSLLLLLTPLLLISLLVLAKPTHAAAVTGFNAGRIMDDAVFTKKNSMSAAQIQTFLNSKVPTCDTWGTKPSEYGGGTRAQYGTSQGYPPPYKCLKSYTQGGKTAAKIIYDAAQEFSINPQVLIVLLQKEQGLVTDTWPWSIQYRSATGYGCPDTAACSTTYYGFTNQVRWSARMFRAILNQSPTWYTPYELGNNRIYWHPDTARCGSSTVNIQNLTTVALYSYTPYRPNQAALDAGYGSGNSCSSYGNRNFYQYFKDWFGSPYGAAYKATYYSQSSHPTFSAGSTQSAYFMYKNTGNQPWYDDISVPSGKNPVHLATTKLINRASVFGSSWGPYKNRPGLTFSKVYEANGTTLASNQHLVQPGQIARFEFTYSIPEDSKPGTYREAFQPIVEGAKTWDMGGIVWHDVKVNAAYTASYVAQTPYPTVTAGQSSVARVRIENTGSQPWYDDTSVPSGKKPVHLATTKPINRVSVFGSDWGPYKNRPGLIFSKVYEADGTTLAVNQHVVQPGQIARFEFTFRIPSGTKKGTYREYFEPILEGGRYWNMNLLLWLDVTVS